MIIKGTLVRELEEIYIEELGDIYDINYHAEASGTYSPGRMYMSNGDPGYPEEFDMEVEEVEIDSILWQNPETGETVDIEECPQTRFIWDAVHAYCEQDAEDCDKWKWEY